MIGIYGGTFDPIHYGHLRCALEVKEALALQELRFIPCYQSPLKSTSHATTAARLAMLQLAIANEPGLVCDQRELQRTQASYTVETLASLRAEFPQIPLLLLLGNDAFAQLEDWYQWQKLFDYAHLLVMTRPASQPVLLNAFLKSRVITDSNQLQMKIAGKLFFQSVTALNISATAIRTLCAEGRSSRFLLPDCVFDYIQQHALYRVSI